MVGEWLGLEVNELIFVIKRVVEYNGSCIHF